jgi:hypothetical protein
MSGGGFETQVYKTWTFIQGRMASKVEHRNRLTEAETGGLNFQGMPGGYCIEVTTCVRH